MTTRNVKESTDVVTMEQHELQPITKLSPATVIGNSTKTDIAQSVLPKEFQGQELETISSGFAPSVKWVNPGNFVGGVFVGFEDGVGPNKSRLYNFMAQDKPFAVWGTTVLDKMMDNGMRTGSIQPGRKMLIIYMGDVETDKEPAKLFTIKIAKIKDA